MQNHRSHSLYYFLAFGALASGCGMCATAAHANEPSKPIQDCAREYSAREPSLKSVGISAAAFFHECWWHTRPGGITKLVSNLPTQAAADTQQAAWHPKERRLRFARHVAKAELDRGKFAKQRKRTAQKLPHPSSSNYALQAWMKRREVMKRPGSWNPAASRFALMQREYILAARIAAHRQRLASLVLRSAPRREPNASEGRVAWIGVTTILGPAKAQAVIVGSLAVEAMKGSSLHCWNQSVLFTSGSPHWGASLVCDDKTETGTQNIWFESYK